MTDVERFLAAKTQLYERQHARISPELCRVCRERGDAFCVGCSGLVPLPLETITEEGENMQVKRYNGHCDTCSRPNRPLTSAVSGECHSCYKKRKYRKEKALEVVGMDRSDETWQEEARRELAGKESEKQIRWLDDGPPLLRSRHKKPTVIDDSDFFNKDIPVYAAAPPSPLPRAEIMRTILNHGPAVRIDVELMDAWRDRGFTADHIMGLMELVLNDELTVIA